MHLLRTRSPFPISYNFGRHYVFFDYLEISLWYVAKGNLAPTRVLGFYRFTPVLAQLVFGGDVSRENHAP